MRGADTLLDALTYAMDRQGGAKAPVAVLNACGAEDRNWQSQCYNLLNGAKSTLEGDFNTVLIRATRQTAETLAFVAQAVKHAAPDARIFIAQDNKHGAESLEKTLRGAFGDVGTLIKYKCRIMTLLASSGDKDQLKRWLDAGGPQKVIEGAYESQPGLFSWDRPDIGSRLLLKHLPASLPGVGADLGCGYGLLSVAAAKKEGVTHLYSLDIDSRAVEACRNNLALHKAQIPSDCLWRDVTKPQPDLPALDWVITNPPFHTQRDENRELGQKFCEAALKMLRSGGMLYLVANRHLPYEAILAKGATAITVLGDEQGFKIVQAKAR